MPFRGQYERLCACVWHAKRSAVEAALPSRLDLLKRALFHNALTDQSPFFSQAQRPTKAHRKAVNGRTIGCNIVRLVSPSSRSWVSIRGSGHETSEACSNSAARGPA